MKLSKIAAACAALCASQAFAHGPTVTPDLEIFISGASAQQKTLGKIIEGMMDTATVDVYFNTNADVNKHGNDYRTYFGTVIGTGTSLDGQKVMVHNRAKGGSVFGVNPVARATAIDRQVISSAACTHVVGAVFPTNAFTYLCNNSVVAKVPDAGVSDVEPKMFTGLNVAAGDVQLTDDDRNLLDANGQLAVVFGVALNDRLPAGLNLSKSQVNSILTGTIKDWSKIPAAGTTGPISVCRRTNGSGTQATFNAYFQGYACSSGAELPSAAQVTASGFRVIENSSSSLVTKCLNDEYTAGRKAIGLLALENPPTATDHYYFASLDGTAATVPNATAGLYDLYSEQSLQWRNDVVNGIDPPAGTDVEVFLNEFLARSGDPAVVSTLPGVAALPKYWTAANAAYTMKGTRSGDTCAATQIVK